MGSTLLGQQRRRRGESRKLHRAVVPHCFDRRLSSPAHPTRFIADLRAPLHTGSSHDAEVIALMERTRAARAVRVATGGAAAPPAAETGCALRPAFPRASCVRAARARAPSTVFRCATPPVALPLVAVAILECKLLAFIRVTGGKVKWAINDDKPAWRHDLPPTGARRRGSAPFVPCKARPRPPAASFAEQEPTAGRPTSANDT